MTQAKKLHKLEHPDCVKNYIDQADKGGMVPRRGNL